MHVWLRIKDLPFSSRIGGSAGLPSLPTPSLSYSLDVNALNFCRFSLLNLPTGSDKNGEPKALISLPNLIDSSTVCVCLRNKVGPKLDRFTGRYMVLSLLGESPCCYRPGGQKIYFLGRSRWKKCLRSVFVTVSWSNYSRN